MAEVMKAIPFTQFSMEMRSGKIIDIDDGKGNRGNRAPQKDSAGI